MSEELDADKKPGTSVRAVVRAMNILITLTAGPHTLRDLASATNLSKGTVHRLLGTLMGSQMVVQSAEDGSYLLGPGCYQLAEAIGRGSGGLGSVARPVLEAVSQETRETATLHVRMGDQRVCVGMVPSPETVRYTTEVGSTAPIYSGSAGKVLLAFLSEPQLDKTLKILNFQGITERTITSAERLRVVLKQTRTRGWAESSGERVTGAAAVSVPIKGPDGEVFAALSVLGPEARITKASMPGLRTVLQAAAEEIEAIWSGPTGDHDAEG